MLFQSCKVRIMPKAGDALVASAWPGQEGVTVTTALDNDLPFAAMASSYRVAAAGEQA
jgi:hypothetical protein